MDMRFGTWNVRSTYRADSLRVAGKEISKYKLDLVGIQEVRWDEGGTEPACFTNARTVEARSLKTGAQQKKNECLQLVAM
jgi:hypothetical protein